MKLQLSPLQGELLRMLSEAGEENLSCIRATLQDIDETQLGQQVDALCRIGLVQKSLEPHSGLPSLVITEAGIAALAR